MLSNESSSRPLDIKIAYIGGGSREWATKLMADLALTDKLTGQLDLYDIDLPAAQHNEKLGEEVFSHPSAQTKFKVRACTTLADALQGADFVIISIEPGSTALRESDLEIPAKYGVLQTVGDTMGPGGILRALRSVPIMRFFAREVMEHCPSAWVINYTNPMSLCTAALFAEAPQIKALGCCHEVFTTQGMLAKMVEKKYGELPARHEIELDLAGVNHFTWVSRAWWKGRDLFPDIAEMIAEPDFFRSRSEDARASIQKEDWFTKFGLIACDLFRRFGALGAAGDRHLVEFVPWYLTSEEELHRWGVVRTPYSWRLARSKNPRETLGLGDKRELKPSGEEGVQQIEALLGLRQFTTNVNLPNHGQMPWLPEGAIVEGYAQFRQNNIRPLVSGPLPAGVQTLVSRTVTEQKLILDAALQCDKDLAFQAMLIDPLVHIAPDSAWAMFNEMLVATREMLPGWKI